MILAMRSSGVLVYTWNVSISTRMAVSTKVVLELELLFRPRDPAHGRLTRRLVCGLDRTSGAGMLWDAGPSEWPIH